MGYLKNELSERSRYYLSKHRYLELKHFCLQYPEWKARLREITEIGATDPGKLGSGQIGNETERIAVERTVLTNKIELKHLQMLMNALGYYSGKIDGDFGAMTDEAVRAYQKAVGFTGDDVDGIVGAMTWGKLWVS